MNSNLRKTASVLCFMVFFSFSLVGCYPSSKPNEDKSSTTTNQPPLPSTNTPTLPLVADTDENYVAKIADDKVSQSEFYFFLNQAKKQMENAAKLSDPKDIETFWNTKVDGKDPKETAIQTTLNNLKEYKIQLLQAKSNNYTLSEQDKVSIQKNLESIIAQNGGEQGISDQLQSQFGISLSSFKNIYNNLTFMEKFMLSKQKEIPVSTEEISKFYTDNKTKIDYVKISHVLYLTTDPNSNTPLSEDKISKSKADAEECLAKVNAGADINELAKTFSQDPGVKDNNGEYVVNKNGQMVPEFEEWAFSKKVGDTGIVKTSYGFHVMKKTAESNMEQGMQVAQTQLQKNKMLENLGKWKTDPKYDIVKNESVFNSLKI